MVINCEHTSAIVTRAFESARTFVPMPWLMKKFRLPHRRGGRNRRDGSYAGPISRNFKELNAISSHRNNEGVFFGVSSLMHLSGL